MVHRGLAVLLLAWFGGAVSRADIIYLAGGGQIEGEVVEEHPDYYRVRVSSAVLRLEKERVKRVVKSEADHREYEKRAGQLKDDDAESHYQLALWCQERKLYEKRHLELLKCVQADSGHRQAQEALGRREYQGQWMTPEEIKEAQGFRKVGDKWLSPEELATREAKKEQGERTRRYYLEIYQELKDLGHEDADQADAALARAKKRGAEAIPVLVNMLRPENQQTVAQRVGAIRGLVHLGEKNEMVAHALAYAASKDASRAVRLAACEAVNELQDDAAKTILVNRALSPEESIRTPAALALREIDDERCHAALVEAIHEPEIRSARIGGETDRRTTYSYRRVGDKGVRVPLRLPTGGGTNVSIGHNLEDPATEALKLIAGKDLGRGRKVWEDWLREKIGQKPPEEDSTKKRRLPRP